MDVVLIEPCHAIKADLFTLQMRKRILPSLHLTCGCHWPTRLDGKGPDSNHLRIPDIFILALLSATALCWTHHERQKSHFEDILSFYVLTLAKGPPSLSIYVYQTPCFSETRLLFLDWEVQRSKNNFGKDVDANLRLTKTIFSALIFPPHLRRYSEGDSPAEVSQDCLPLPPLALLPVLPPKLLLTKVKVQGDEGNQDGDGDTGKKNLIVFLVAGPNTYGKYALVQSTSLILYLV